MQSPTTCEQSQPHIQDIALNPSPHNAFNIGIEWRETCWFLKREEDELAGYLFAEDFEMREGSD